MYICLIYREYLNLKYAFLFIEQNYHNLSLKEKLNEVLYFWNIKLAL